MNLQTAGDATIETTTFSYAKRQGWTDEHLTERHDPPALLLSEHGMIQDCSKALETLFGFLRRDLVLHHVSILFPQLTGIELIQVGQINPLLNYLCHCGQLYQAQNRQGYTFSSNLSFVSLEYNGNRSLRMIVRPSGSTKS